MNCWDYINGVPQIPVRLMGKTTVEELGLVDCGATYCVVHPKIAKLLGLKFQGSKPLYGLGSIKSISADMANMEIEIGNLRESVEVACIREEHYPPMAPEVIIGRNFMNKYAFILDGERVCIEDKRILKEKLNKNI